MKPATWTIGVLALAFLVGGAHPGWAQTKKPVWVGMEYGHKTILIKPGPGSTLTMASQYRGEKGWKIHGLSQGVIKNRTKTWTLKNGVACHHLKTYEGQDTIYSEVVIEGKNGATRMIRNDDTITGRRKIKETYRRQPDGSVLLTEVTTFPMGTQRTSQRKVRRMVKAINPDNDSIKVITRR